jgi:hypothetical protein
VDDVVDVAVDERERFHWLPDDARLNVSITGSPGGVRVNAYHGGSPTFADEVEVDWGDGAADQVDAGDAAEVVHAYAQPGDYAVTVTTAGVEARTRAYVPRLAMA